METNHKELLLIVQVSVIENIKKKKLILTITVYFSYF